MSQYLDWQRATRPPAVALPSHACDCAIHVFDAAQSHRLVAGRRYDPPAASLADLQAMHLQLGITRAVLVQPSVYGRDHTVLLEALRSAPDRYRGVALLDDSIDDTACRVLHEAGVRSARFNILSRFGAPFDTAAFQRNVARARALGWSISLHATAAELATHAELLLRINAPLVIDHAAYLVPADMQDRAGQFVARAVARGNTWVKLSRFDHRFPPPYDTVVSLMRQLVALNPQRMIWATDWPHPLYDAATATMPNDADLIELLARVVPDAETREQILVHNPSQLFDFPV